MVEIYGTIGPSFCKKDQLKEMIELGMTGVRLNLSHSNLEDCKEWLENYWEAQKESHTANLIMDMKGPELRLGKMSSPIYIKEKEIVELNSIPFPKEVIPYLVENQKILINDGIIELEVINNTQAICLRPGECSSSKSVALPGKEIHLPVLTESDISNIRNAKKYHVTGIMQPFVRGKEDLLEIKRILKENDVDLKIYAKIENMDGVEKLREIAGESDMIIIARGDLGNAMPLSLLPKVQKEISDTCVEMDCPFMVVTQMLNSMIHSPIPTRAEVSDIFHAVTDGASAVMLTGETAAGEYPLQAMKMMIDTVKNAEQYLNK